jgi:hypothetical protein
MKNILRMEFQLYHHNQKQFFNHHNQKQFFNHHNHKQFFNQHSHKQFLTNIITNKNRS